MGCCSAKRKSHFKDDSCYVCDNIGPYSDNIYTLNLLKCYPKQPAMKFTNKPRYNPSSTQKVPCTNLNFNGCYNCGCMDIGYERLDSIKPIENYETSSTDDEAEETKCSIIRSKPTKQLCSNRYKPKGTCKELSTISYECKSSDSYLSFTCKCLHCKTPRHYKGKYNDGKESCNLKHIGIQKESEKCCNVRDKHDDYIKKMENSWHCCYNLLHEIKELLSGIDECDDRDLTRHSPIAMTKKYALPYTTIPIYSGILENDTEETNSEDHFRPTSE